MAPVDVLNALNNTAEEGLAADNLFNPNFGQSAVFMDPRRVMVGVRLNLGSDVGCGRATIPYR